ncbi:hypothetical protein ACLKMH_16250 [Psychromonas sp. KJ10-10]|uniref:hypothetical protein n=1 Tax=Psychromonas sp. KJ10-10 TaxID=3391823 RepID=UPI0039B58D4D
MKDLTQMAGLVVESTFNWYWLVDALNEAKFGVHLANTADYPAIFWLEICG